MISLESLSKKHIAAESSRMKMADPAVLERTMHAFVLLERLALSDMPFLFKGGTSLLLALGKPERVSVDIDIVCRVPKDKFESELREWVKHPPFTAGFARGALCDRQWQFYIANGKKRTHFYIGSGKF